VDPRDDAAERGDPPGEAPGLESVPETAATVAETHSAVVFFVGDRAYKLKKRVDLGFLDFTTREARERTCHREVELNRRLAPDVYLGVADVVGPDGQPCDHLVVMRRLPEDRRLATVLSTGEDVTDALRAVARQIAVLHSSVATSRTDPEIARVATRDAVARNWQDNRDTLSTCADNIVPRAELDRVSALARQYLAGRQRLFDLRIADGMVRDGHGDLLAQDVFCLSDGPRILDCLEFADHYRFGDVLLDVAFLAMDLERLGHPELAAHFLRWYRDFSGEQHPESLAHHYLAYRAHVRAKVACVRHAQGELRAAEEARTLHRLALDHLERGRIALVLVGGLPGTGKSTVARALAEQLDAALLRSDELRKEMAGMDATTSASAPYRHGLYARDQVAGVYGELRDRARRLLELGVPVVIDASFTSAAERDLAAAVAAETSSSLVQLHCVVPLEVARARLAARPPESDASDATEEVLEAMVSDADAWPEATAVRTNDAIDVVLGAARSAVRDQLAATPVTTMG
jgi:uncharacterized protein